MFDEAREMESDLRIGWPLICDCRRRRISQVYAEVARPTQFERVAFTFESNGHERMTQQFEKAI